MSINGSNKETIPSLTGSLVFVAECAIEAEPTPASFEKAALLKPWIITHINPPKAALGGPGATFWMIVCGLIGMSTKFVECTLGVKYRVVNDEGEVSGGPMYYLKNGLAKYGFSNLGKVLAVLFAILCIGGSFGGGNMFQANQAYAQLSGQFPMLSGNGPMFGFILAILVGTVIIGGIKSIAKVT